MRGMGESAADRSGGVRKARHGPVAVLTGGFVRYHRSRVGRWVDRRVVELSREWADARLRAALGACGESTFIDRFVVVNGPASVRIGDGCSVNSFVHIWGFGGVMIGDRVMLASHAAITSITHDYIGDRMHETVVNKPVVIGDEAWIGSHAVVMPGVTVGRGAVVGAGAVVTRDVPDFAIVVGVPAKVRGYRPGHGPE